MHGNMNVNLFPPFRNAALSSSSRASSPFFFDWMNLEVPLAERHSATSEIFVLCSLTINRDGSEFMWKGDAVKRLTWRACNVTPQSMLWMFRNGTVGKRFRYCDWQCSLRNVPNVPIFPSPLRWITKPLLVHRSVTLFSCRRVRTAILSNVFPLLYTWNSIETSRKIQDAGKNNLSVCSNEHLRSHTMTTPHRCSVKVNLQSVVHTDITRLAEVYTYITTYCASPLPLLARQQIV
jgi:hypothetical protein